MNVSKLEYTSERQFLFRHDTNWYVQNEYEGLEWDEDNIDFLARWCTICVWMYHIGSYLSRSCLLAFARNFNSWWEWKTTWRRQVNWSVLSDYKKFHENICTASLLIIRRKGEDWRGCWKWVYFSCEIIRAGLNTWI